MNLLEEFDFPFLIIYGALTALFTAIIFHVFRFRYWSKQGVRGPTPLPLVGNSIDTIFGQPLLDWMSECSKKYGSVYGVYRGTVPHLIIGDPEMLKDVMVGDWQVFADRRGGCIDGNPITDNFLVSLSGEGWKRMRSAMSPTFTSGKMKAMYHIMEDCSQLMIENIGKKVDEEVKRNDQGAELNIRHLCSCVAMDIIAKCCFATDSNSFDDPNHVFVIFAKKFFDVTIWRRLLSVILPNWIRGLVGFSVNPMDSLQPLAEITKTIIDQRSKEGHFGTIKDGAKLDYLQLLIEASEKRSKVSRSQEKEIEENIGSNLEVPEENQGRNSIFKPLTVEEIISNSVLFFAVGFDTTSSLIAATCYLLACNQDIQFKLYNELKDAYEQGNNKFGYDTITGLKYLEAVISEALRIFPSAPAIERRVLENYTFKKNGIKVPKGGIVTLPIWHMHHDSKYWDQPAKFDPDRFLPENRSRIVPYSYIPFGGGPRSCIGMRFALIVSKLTIAHLILNYKLIRTPNTNIPIDLTQTVDAVLFSPKRVMVGVQRR